MTRMIDILRSTAIYDELLRQVPEEERSAAIAMLEEQIQPYEALLSALPSNAIENLVSSLSKDTGTTTVADTRPERRPPRRF